MFQNLGCAIVQCIPFPLFTPVQPAQTILMKVAKNLFLKYNLLSTVHFPEKIKK